MLFTQLRCVGRDALEKFLEMLCNLQEITCLILRNLFGLYLFSHQSCATGTLHLRKHIYPRKSSLNLRQLIFLCYLGMDKKFSGGFCGLLWPDVRNSGAFRRFVVGALFGGF